MTISLARGEIHREPQRAPGAIQSHGVFLAVDPEHLTITHVSDNTERLLGIEPVALLGSSLTDLLGRESVADILRVVSDSSEFSNPTRVMVRWSRFDVISRRSGRSLFVELEPQMESDGTALLSMRDAMRSMATAETMTELWTRAASGVRKVTGYDRVDISYFHPDGHGEVVAAAQADDMESHLGVHFPESNIPDQPSRVYLIKRSRLVANTRESVALLSEPSGSVDAELDLTTAVLAAPSPRDLQLLNGVGHTATFSLTIVRNNVLLGVITCSHRTERRLRYNIRDALELLANQLSLQVGAMQEIHRLRQRDVKREMRSTLVAPVSAGEDIVDALLGGYLTVLDLVPASGAAIHLNGRLGTIGTVPSADFLEHLPAAITAGGGTIDFSSSALPTEFPRLAQAMPGVAGMLVRRLGSNTDYIAWFRGEETYVFDWARDLSEGGPLPGLSRHGSLRTRRPDAAGMSAPWSAVEGAASELSRELESALLNRARAELADMALRDSLTGLLNRRALMDALDHRLASDSSLGRVALLFVDLDDFKSVNDRYGHAAGDAALVHVARALRSAARDSDIISRLGGDEFVLVIDGVDDGAAMSIASRVLDAVQTPPADGSSWRVTASVGVALAAADQDASHLLNAADAAMFRAKQGGRNRVSR